MRQRRYAKSTAEIGAACGVTQQAASLWTREPGFPSKGVRGWELAEVRAWVERRAGSSGKAQAGAAPVASLRERKMLKEIEYLDARVRRSLTESETVLAAERHAAEQRRQTWARKCAAGLAEQIERWRLAQVARAETAPVRNQIEALTRDLREFLADGCPTALAEEDADDRESGGQ